MRVFSPEWFRHHQRILLWALNHWLTRWFVRRSLCIDCAGRIDELGPHFYRVGSRWEFYTTEYYAHRLAQAYAPLWEAMHLWDEFVDETIPELSFGFGTYGPYSPGAGAGTTCDGEVSYNVDGTWASIHDAAVADGVSVTQTVTGPGVYAALTPANRFSKIARIFMSFDTSPIGSGKTVYKSTLSIQRNYYATDGFNASAKIGIVTSNQSNPGTLVGSNYADFNEDVETNTYTTVATWNASGGGGNFGLYTFPTMESNYASINPTGITKLGARINWDIDDSAPTWVANAYAEFVFAMADNISGFQPPRLTVYTMSAPTLSAATLVTGSSMRINWTSDAPGHLIDVATDAGFSNLIVDGATTDASTYHDISGLASVTTYYYRVWGYYSPNGAATSKSDSSQATAQWPRSITFSYGSGAATSRILTNPAMVKGFSGVDGHVEFPGIRHQHLDGSVSKKQAGYRRIFEIDFGIVTDSTDMNHIGLWLVNEWQYISFEGELDVQVVNLETEFRSVWENGVEIGRRIIVIAEEADLAS